jgi:hypothetical protein
MRNSDKIENHMVANYDCPDSLLEAAAEYHVQD